MGNDLTVIPDETIAALDDAAEFGKKAGLELAPFKRSVMIATALNRLRSIISGPVLKEMLKLKDSALGFLTDKGMRNDEKRFVPYTDEQVRDCLIEAAIKGVYPVGNQFNIIQGRCYITKEGFHHLLKQTTGLKYDMTPEVPQLNDRKGLVNMKIHWTYKGEEHTEVVPFVVKLNFGMEEDAAIGKATRKARAWLYQMVTGVEMCDGEAEDDGVIDVQTTSTVSRPAKPELKNLIPKIPDPYKGYESKIGAAVTLPELQDLFNEMNSNTVLTSDQKKSLKENCTKRRKEIESGNSQND